MTTSTTTLLTKLQHKGGPVVILNAPAEFAETMDRWRSDGLPVSQRRTPGSMFVLTFVRSQAEIERCAGAVLTSVGRDGILWFAYPKENSARYRTDIAREQSWAVLGRMGFENIRQVSIDSDWAALRFRHIDAIRAMRRPTTGSLAR